MPTLLEKADREARVVREEVFGPVVPVFQFSHLNDAIKQANDTIYGLGASIWTRSLVSANRAIDRLAAGNVWVSSLHYGYDELPFGASRRRVWGASTGRKRLTSTSSRRV